MGIVEPQTESLWFGWSGLRPETLLSNKLTGDADASIGTTLWELYSEVVNYLFNLEDM